METIGIFFVMQQICNFKLKFPHFYDLKFIKSTQLFGLLDFNFKMKSLKIKK